ncbi:MAG TPA: M20/M25/M40 family metallo-hydrolase [Pyrinomonadaceae bacterium]|nr:M20/M25/M40 family metallo-hydrolase [Pyrinomonadaceae bacterium]
MTLTRDSESSDADNREHLHTNGARIALVLLLALGLIAALSIQLQNRLPEVLPDNASAAEFSAARALKHLQVIGARPHPIGSQEHAAVRNYIFNELASLGFNPERQQTTAVNRMWGAPFSAGSVENVAARIKGTEGGRALLLVAHYDSVPTGAGASDDGAGVVSLLETARALRSAPAPKNDVILLFTDGEEVGLLGACAFIDEHRWAKDVGLFLNFEARGNSGPLVMFETNGGNGELIRQFADAAQRPLANSFFYEIYQRLPNDTDFTVLKRLGVQGMNFAYVNGINHYHTQLDSVREINSGSLQYEGSSALALAKHFGNADLNAERSSNAVYFNVLGRNFINYPGALIIPLLLSAVLLFGFVVVYGIRVKELTVSGIVLGFVAFLFGVIVSAAIVWLAWWLIGAVQQSYRWAPWAEPYHSNAFRVGFVLLAFAAVSAIYVLLRKRAGAPGLMAGALLWWLILSACASVLLPGGSYLFTLPLLFSLSGLALVSVLKLDGAKARFVFALAAIPGIVLWAPMIYNVFVALTLNASWMVVIFVGLLCGLVVPLIFPLVNSRRRWLFPGLLTLGCLCLVLVGLLTSGFDKQHPRVNHVFYALDADTGKALFASSDSGTDAWTTQFFNAGAERGTLPEYFPGSPRAYLKSPAPAATLDGPEAVLIDDRTEGDVRTLSFRVTSQRQAPILSIFAEPDIEVFDSSINGKQTVNNVGGSSTPGPPLKRWGIQYYALPAVGLDVSLKTRGGKPFKLFVVDRSYGLPDIPGSPFKARTEEMMPAPYSTSDVTLVAKSFTF